MTRTAQTALVVTHYTPNSGAAYTRTETIEIRDTDHWRRFLTGHQRDRDRAGDRYFPSTARVFVIKADANGIPQVKPLARCEACSCYKVPGTRHKHDPRRAPQTGSILRSNHSGARWTGDLTDDSMFGASRDDERWAPWTCSETIRVTAIEIDPGYEPFEYDGKQYGGQEPTTKVQYEITRAGDWTQNMADQSMPEGTDYMGLDEWRSAMAEGWKPVCR